MWSARQFPTIPAGLGGLALGVALYSVELFAQIPETVASLRGVAFDSLRGQPFAGAVVSLLGRGRVTLSDNRGRFAFDSLTRGSYTIVVEHDSLDSIGWPPLHVRADASTTQDTVRIHGPSRRELQQRVCSLASDGTAFFFGRVRSARTGRAISGATVRVGWQSLPAPAAGRASLEGVGVQADSTGFYAACSLPANQSLIVQALAGGETTDVLDLNLGQLGLGRLDLGVAPKSDSTARGGLEGIVRRRDGKPASDAILEMLDGRSARSDTAGRFAFRDVPIGTRALQVRALGMAPGTRIVDVPLASSTFVSVELEPLTVLDSARVTASTSQQRFRAELLKRAELGIAKVIDSSVVDSRGTLVGALLNVAQVRVDRSGRITFPGPFGPCSPVVMIDGRELPDQSELRILNTGEIGAIEVYPRGTGLPTEFWPRRGLPCAALLIWTKRKFP